MAKKKKEKSDDKSEQLKLNLHHNTKKGIAIVVLILVAVLFAFGFFGAGGAVGKFLNKIGGMIFGWGKWLFPVVLLLSASILLFKKRNAFYIAKILGLSIVFISWLGFTHIFYETDKILEIAQAGHGGGFIGYFISALLIKLTGKWAGVMVLLAMMAIGAMVAFNFSVVEFFARFLDKEKYSKSLNKIIKKKDRSVFNENGKEDIKKIRKEEEKKKEEDRRNLKNNIKEIKFVESPDKNIKQKAKLTKNITKENNNIKKIENFAVKKNQEISEWMLPDLTFLTPTKGVASGGDIEKNVEIIENTFHNFNIEIKFEEAKVGPTVTQYSFRPAMGIKLSRIVALNDDLALALAMHPIRIEAPIPGKSLVGIEVPNRNRITIGLRELLEDYNFQESKSALAFPLGKNVEGDVVMAYLEKMPHLLVAGATNTGKSVCINSLIISLLYKNSPEDLKMIFVDPKRVELTPYNGIPHLLSDVVVSGSKVVKALRWAIDEMERRYKLFQDVKVRNISAYQAKQKRGVKRNYVDEDTGEVIEEKLSKVPYIVIVIDELSDLMASHGKEIEGAIVRLAQKARAVGIHLIVSTQRPSVEVITGLIKANISARIALQVNDQINSRTILDMRGAEDLLGKGDLLFLAPDNPKPKRLQGSFVSDEEIKRVVDFVKKQAKEIEKQRAEEDANNENNRVADITAPQKKDLENKNDDKLDFGKMQFKEPTKSEENDNMIYEEAKKMVIEMKKASASLLQRRMRIGFNRAARLIDMLEEKGVIGPAQGSKPRDVLASDSKNDEVDQAQRDKWQI